MPRSYGITNAAPWAAEPPVGDAGDTYFNTADSSLYLSDGTVWIKVGSGEPANYWYSPINPLTLSGDTDIACAVGAPIRSAGFSPGWEVTCDSDGLFLCSAQVTTQGVPTAGTGVVTVSVVHGRGAAEMERVQASNQGETEWSEITASGVFDLRVGDTVYVMVRAETGVGNDDKRVEVGSFLSITQVVGGAKGDTGPSGGPVPTGGAIGQIIVKQSATDMDVSWEDQASAGLPPGGATGEVLTKQSATDEDADWSPIPAPPPGLPDGGTTGSVLTKQTDTDQDVIWVPPTSLSGLLYESGEAASGQVGMPAVGYVNSVNSPLGLAPGLVNIVVNTITWFGFASAWINGQVDLIRLDTGAIFALTPMMQCTVPSAWAAIPAVFAWQVQPGQEMGFTLRYNLAQTGGNPGWYDARATYQIFIV